MSQSQVPINVQHRNPHLQSTEKFLRVELDKIPQILLSDRHSPDKDALMHTRLLGKQVRRPLSSQKHTPGSTQQVPQPSRKVYSQFEMTKKLPKAKWGTCE